MVGNLVVCCKNAHLNSLPNREWTQAIFHFLYLKSSDFLKKAPNFSSRCLPTPKPTNNSNTHTHTHKHTLLTYINESVLECESNWFGSGIIAIKCKNRTLKKRGFELRLNFAKRASKWNEIHQWYDATDVLINKAWWSIFFCWNTST